MKLPGMPPSTACLSRGGAGTASLRAAVTARRARCVSHATAARRAPVRVAAQQGLAVVHIYETLQKPALFESFLEGMTHVLEVVSNARLPACLTSLAEMDQVIMASRQSLPSHGLDAAQRMRRPDHAAGFSTGTSTIVAQTRCAIAATGVGGRCSGSFAAAALHQNAVPLFMAEQQDGGGRSLTPTCAPPRTCTHQARYHPGFKTANVHTCLDQEALDAGAPFSYLNFSVFEAAPGVSSLAELSEPHSDWMTSMEFGHDGQEHHPILVR